MNDTKTEQMSITDLGEMLGFAYVAKEAGAERVTIDTEHAIEILERLTEALKLMEGK